MDCWLGVFCSSGRLHAPRAWGAWVVLPGCPSRGFRTVWVGSATPESRKDAEETTQWLSAVNLKSGCVADVCVITFDSIFSYIYLVYNILQTIQTIPGWFLTCFFLRSSWVRMSHVLWGTSWEAMSKQRFPCLWVWFVPQNLVFWVPKSFWICKNICKIKLQNKNNLKLF